MALKDNWNNPVKLARLEMEDAERKAKKAMEQIEKAEKAEENPRPANEPKRYRLYDKIKVSLRTMDIIIYSVVALLVFCLVFGIATGGQV